MTTSASSALPSTPSPSLPSPEELRPPDRRHHGVKLNVKMPKMPEVSSVSTATSPPLYSASSALPSTPSPSLPSPEELRPPDRRHHGVKLNVKMPKMPEVSSLSTATSPPLYSYIFEPACFDLACLLACSSVDVLDAPSSTPRTSLFRTLLHESMIAWAARHDKRTGHHLRAQQSLSAHPAAVDLTTQGSTVMRKAEHEKPKAKKRVIKGTKRIRESPAPRGPSPPFPGFLCIDRSVPRGLPQGQIYEKPWC